VAPPKRQPPAQRKRAPARPRTKARRRRSPVPRALAVCALVLAAFLYYRPVQSYVHTRSEVHKRQAEVDTLRAREASLQHQLKVGATEAARLVQARRLGYVRPGEKLYSVTGIAAWRAAHAKKSNR
jgi:cell division protein FtsB